MSFEDAIETSEKVEPIRFAAARDYATTYGNLILSKDTDDTQHVAYLTDYLRMMRTAQHWNPETKSFDLCNSMYKRPCTVCEPTVAMKALGKKASAASISREGFTWHFENVDSTRVSEKGTEYDLEPICIISNKAGSGGINLKTLLEANCEHPNYPEPHDFYTNDGKSYTLDKSTLMDNRLMYDENGSTKVWQIRKVVPIDPATKKPGRPSYPEPRFITKDKAKKNLGPQAKLDVPKEVRDFFDNASLKDLVPFYLVGKGNVDWKYYDLEPPKAGQKFVFPPKREAVTASSTKSKVDANLEL